MDAWLDNQEVSTTKTIKINHSDGWGYKVTGYEDGIEITYFETRSGVDVDTETFNLSDLVAKEVCEAILEVSKK
jgi:hypothetical protein